MGKPGRRTAEALATLDAVYAALPTIACHGACHIACGPIPLTVMEADRIRRTMHRHARTVGQDCVFLMHGRCSVYAVRPLICRLYGLVKRMSCPYGCVPSRWLSDSEALAILQAAEQAGGGFLLTTPSGVIDVGDTFLDITPTRPDAEVEAEAEITRGLRALYGGRIVAVVPSGSPGGGFVNVDDLAAKRRHAGGSR